MLKQQHLPMFTFLQAQSDLRKLSFSWSVQWLKWHQTKTPSCLRLGVTDILIGGRVAWLSWWIIWTTLSGYKVTQVNHDIIQKGNDCSWFFLIFWYACPTCPAWINSGFLNLSWVCECMLKRFLSNDAALVCNGMSGLRKIRKPRAPLKCESRISQLMRKATQLSIEFLGRTIGRCVFRVLTLLSAHTSTHTHICICICHIAPW